jgi:ribulose bisphosphate carboxylase small subunit
MFKTVVNLTQQAVITEIENVLDTYPCHPYQRAFAIPDLRQELIAYVLNRIPCVYSVVDSEQKAISFNYQLPSSQQQLQLENLIHQGICSILQERSDWVNHHLPESVQCSIEPSHWFG